ncbi:hypothetical protein, partial [Escherichia coli]
RRVPEVLRELVAQTPEADLFDRVGTLARRTRAGLNLVPVLADLPPVDGLSVKITATVPNDNFTNVRIRQLERLTDQQP